MDNSEIDLSALPRWKCHKIVRAAKIIAIKPKPPWSEDGSKARFLIDVLPDPNTLARVSVEVPVRIFARGIASIGDYLVGYDDGYVSWLPAAAFEAGYERLQEGG